MTRTARLMLLVLALWSSRTTNVLAEVLPGNFLPNPSVELDDDLNGIPDGWLLGGNDPSGDIWDDTRPVSGERNLLLFDTGENNYTSWYTNVDVPADTDELQFRWTWAYEFTSENPGDEFRMTVAWRSAGSDIAYDHVVVRDDQPDYLTEDRLFVVPDGTDALRLEFVTGGSQTETGVMYVDDISIAVPGVAIPGDYNNNGVLDAPDIDELTQAPLCCNWVQYDLNNDSFVNLEDISFWVKELFGSWIGDANLDHEFNSSDLVGVLAAGTYETDANAVWTTGDFDGSGRSNSGDLVAALSDGGYELGPPAAAVPEPGGWLLLGLGWIWVTARSQTLRR
jgi:hypothetical protein